MRLTELSGITFAHFYSLLPSKEETNSVLFKGRKYVVLIAASLPAISILIPTTITILNNVFLVTGLVCVVASSVFESTENVHAKVLCTRVIAYCFALVPGSALCIDLLDLTSRVVALGAGTLVAVGFSTFMKQVIEKEQKRLSSAQPEDSLT